MKKIAIVASMAAFLLTGCEKIIEFSNKFGAKKEQVVIFQANSVSCSGNMMCSILVQLSEEDCRAMSENLSKKLSEGWRVVSSSSKEVPASRTGQVKCIGTEYVIEK